MWKSGGLDIYHASTAGQVWKKPGTRVDTVLLHVPLTKFHAVEAIVKFLFYENALSYTRVACGTLFFKLEVNTPKAEEITV